MRIHTSVAPLILMVGLVGAGCITSIQPHTRLPSLLLPAPSAEEDQIDLGLRRGSSLIHLSDLPARYFVVEVFHTTCHYCVQSVPALNKLYAGLRDQQIDEPVIMLGIGLNNSPAEVASFKKEHGLTFPVISDPEGKTYTFWHIRHTPTLLVLRKENNHFMVLHTHTGLIRSGTVRQVLQILQSEPALTRKREQ